MSIWQPIARSFTAVCFLALVLLCPTRQAHAQVISVRAGYVTRVEGETWVRRHGATELSALQQSDSLVRGDVVLTGNDGRAEMTLTPGSYMQVGPLAEVWIYAIEDDRIHFDILRGEVSATIEGNIGDTPLVLDTPPAELDIVKRGHYILQVAADGSTEAYVEAGELLFVDSNEVTVRLKKHKRVRFAAPARR
ncbi:MAG: hypothetical protein QOJ70_137 [Acidobacteriota bacterium]|jgi:hypothetical protein|nr:hypothetical protein [Acidobacteriota bacterium]